jgi:hypothetical protein
MGAPQQGVHTRQQLLKRERFDQIVVGARLQTGHAIGDFTSSAQDQYARTGAGLPHLSEQSKTIDARQVQVESDAIVTDRGGQLQSLFAVFGQVNREMFRFKPLHQAASNFGLVFNDQDAQIPPVAPPSKRLERLR